MIDFLLERAPLIVPKYTLLVSAAFSGSEAVMRRCYDRSRDAPPVLTQAFIVAATHGHIDCMRLLRLWGATDYDGKSVYRAAAGMQVEALNLLADWNIKMDGILSGSVRTLPSLIEAQFVVSVTAKQMVYRLANTPVDRLDWMKTCRERYPRADVETAFIVAARYGTEDRLRLCLEWLGGTPPSVSRASSKTKPELLALWKSWLAVPAQDPLAQVLLAQVPLAQIPLAQDPLAQVPPARRQLSRCNVS